MSNPLLKWQLLGADFITSFFNLVFRRLYCIVQVLILSNLKQELIKDYCYVNFLVIYILQRMSEYVPTVATAKPDEFQK